VLAPLGQHFISGSRLLLRTADPSKAVIVDAKVAAISATTNVRYQTTTNGSGEYYLV